MLAPFAAHPSESGNDFSKSALAGGVKLGRIDRESPASQFGKRESLDRMVVEVLSNDLLPGVGLVTSVLLRRDGVGLEFPIGPPLLFAIEGAHGLGEQLISIRDQRVDVDGAGDDGPKAPATSHVAEIGALG